MPPIVSSQPGRAEARQTQSAPAPGERGAGTVAAAHASDGSAVGGAAIGGACGPAAGEGSDSRLARWGDGLVFTLLTVLVWGLTAPLRGFWQDDTLMAGLVVARWPMGLRGILAMTVGPLRRLYELPYWLAYLTPHPLWALQLMYGACWLGHGLAAAWIVAIVFPEHPRARFVTAALVLTATSDYLTDNLTALGYNFAVLTFLLALGCGLRFARRGGLGYLLASAGLLAISLWTIEVALPALPFLPFLLMLLLGVRRRARSIAILVAWAAVAAPAAWIEWAFLKDPASYAALALQPLPATVVLDRALDLWTLNFTPWAWPLARVQWYPRPPAAIPAMLGVFAALIGTAIFVVRAAQKPRGSRPSSSQLALVLVFAAMALAANAAYARVQMAEIHYRTHVLSRIWSTVAVALLVEWCAARWPRLQAGALVVASVFVACGIAGGVERQDLFLSTWRLHAKELASIVDAAPGIGPDTEILLCSGNTPNAYLATEADYLAWAWLTLLYDRPMHSLRVAPERGTGCTATERGLDCWHEGQAECVANGGCAADHFDYRKLLVFDYDDVSGTYRLRQSLAGDPMVAGITGSSQYRPDAAIVRRQWSVGQRRLLLR